MIDSGSIVVGALGLSQDSVDYVRGGGELGKCEICGKEAKLKKAFGGMLCPKCIENMEEDNDEFDLKVLETKRGKEWIIKRLWKLTLKL